jgi:hypothetical protein
MRGLVGILWLRDSLRLSIVVRIQACPVLWWRTCRRRILLVAHILVIDTSTTSTTSTSIWDLRLRRLRLHLVRAAAHADARMNATHATATASTIQESAHVLGEVERRVATKGSAQDKQQYTQPDEDQDTCQDPSTPSIPVG